MQTVAINSANTVNSPTPTSNQPQQKQTAKEVIAANVQALIEQLEQGHSEGLTAYLTAMGRFHNYSFGNILEIARQKNAAQVLRDATTAYKVDVDAISLKVKQEFAAKEKAKLAPKPAGKTTQPKTKRAA